MVYRSATIFTAGRRHGYSPRRGLDTLRWGRARRRSSRSSCRIFVELEFARAGRRFEDGGSMSTDNATLTT